MTSRAHSAVFESLSPDDTLALGAALGRVFAGGLTVALVGPLGAGKTHLVKGVAIGNGATDPRKVTSPTFTLIHEYAGRLTLYHVDVYRLRGPAEVVALGMEELIRADSVVLVEWADRVRNLIPAPRLTIEIEPLAENSRRLTMAAEGEAAIECLSRLQCEPR